MPLSLLVSTGYLLMFVLFCDLKPCDAQTVLLASIMNCTHQTANA